MLGCPQGLYIDVFISFPASVPAAKRKSHVVVPTGVETLCCLATGHIDWNSILRLVNQAGVAVLCPADAAKQEFLLPSATQQRPQLSHLSTSSFSGLVDLGRDLLTLCDP